MIDLNQAKSPDAIEQIVCIPFEKAKCFPMDKETMETYLQVCTLPRDFSIPEKEKPFLVSVIEKRIKFCFSFKITDERLMLILAMISETPGCAIMYLWYLQYWCKKNNTKELNLNIFSENIFPFGFPSENDLHKIWENQKVSTGSGLANLVDNGESGISVQFLKADI